jgi:hypothetical protein
MAVDSLLSRTLRKNGVANLGDAPSTSMFSSTISALQGRSSSPSFALDTSEWSEQTIKI